MAESKALMAPRLEGSRAEAEAWSRLFLGGSKTEAEAEAWSRLYSEGSRAGVSVMAESKAMAAPRLEVSRAEAQAGVSAMSRRLKESRAQADASRLRLEGSKADAQALAQSKAWSRAKAQAKAKGKGKGPTWAEAQALEKRLESINDKITNLAWRLNLEKFRGCFGDGAVTLLFPSNTRGLREPSDDEMEVMLRCMDFTYEFEKRRRLLADELKNRQLAHAQPCFSGISGRLDPGAVSKRLRKEYTEDEELSEEEDESQKPHHIKKMVEELTRLDCECMRLLSEQRTPDFSGMTEAERAVEAERLREEAFLKASRLWQAGDIDGALRLQGEACVLDFDPKKKGIYYNKSLTSAILPYFDLAEESPIGPMRFTNKVFEEKEMELHDAVNILSVKVASSDVGFPIQVYGTVIARDCTDYKCVYLFQRDREHCQLINSKDEPLILTGPKRGLLLLAENYVETDLMIKDHQGQDREFSRGVFNISGVAGRSPEKCEVDTLSLATRLSTVKVAYAYVVSALEATISIEVEEGEFCGTISAHTTSIKNRVVLYDSQLADHMPGRGAIKMMRPVISVFFEDKLMIIARVHGGKAVGFKITPKISNGNEVEFTLGTAKMRLRVAWSILDNEHGHC